MERMRDSAVVALLSLAGLFSACSDETPSGTDDTIAPEVEIVRPANGSSVVAADLRPAISVETSDRGTGVFDSSIQATLNGQEVSDDFRNNFNETTGQIQLKSPRTLVEGGNTLELTISDRAGNEATAQSTFTLTRVPIGPPPPPD